MWRIYYGNGKYVDTETGPTGDMARDVQAILQDNEDVGWAMVTSADYYVLRDGRWWPVDIFGLFDFLMDTGLVVFGRTITNDEYRDVVASAKADMNLARKGGYLGRNQERIP